MTARRSAKLSRVVKKGREIDLATNRRPSPLTLPLMVVVKRVK